MIQKVIVTKMKVEFRFRVPVAECTIECESLNLEERSWKCKFPNDIPLVSVAQAIVDLFGMKDIKIKFIKFDFNKTEILVEEGDMKEGEEYFSILDKITKQIN